MKQPRPHPGNFFAWVYKVRNCAELPVSRKGDQLQTNTSRITDFIMMRNASLRSPFYPCLGALLAVSTTVLALAAEPSRSRPRPTPPSANGAPSAEADRFFETKVRPVLATRCQSCHGADRQSGGLRVDSREALLKGGTGGTALVPGKPEQSLLLRALSYEHNRLKMPPGGKLPAAQIADLTRWVAMGAPWPAVGTPLAASARQAHWAFQPIQNPPVPRPRKAGWVRTPIDAFILAELEKKGLQPAPPADRRTLLRRATFDLTGLPPTPEEIAAFLADRSPNAWEKVIERLLASPAYGERWGRHWLDVARYADSNGLDENVAYGNAWRYRDWVIRAFNDDKPYDEFVVEQLAGDLLPTEDRPTRHSRLTATGFLVLGPKVLAEPDKEKMVMDIVDEQIDTTGKAFMGLTLGCARCHDHKFDPISAKDYYALAGIFKSTRTMESLKTVARWWENPIPSPEEQAAYEAHQKRIAGVEAQIHAVINREKQALIAAGTAESALPKNLEGAFPAAAQAELKQLRAQVAQLRKETPELPSAMGVTEGDILDVPVHIRGDHLTLGEKVPRRFPVVLAGNNQPSLPSTQSGRLQFARWLVSPDHPLTSRVMVNRVWRWHFGRGIVASTDNFGLLGEKPTHPELLDWLARRFMADKWSVKRLHRLIMLSSTYQMSTQPHPKTAAADPENRLLGRANVRRLEAEEMRDALLAVSGTLDRTMGGSLLHVKNHEFFFDHTSKDGTRYDSKKRAVYLPVVRNNVYDVFQLFDFVDPAVLESNRATTTVAPQALFWMNSDLVSEAAQTLAKRLLEQSGEDDGARIRRVHEILYGRLASEQEIAQGRVALARLMGLASESEPAKRRLQAWGWYCQALLAANEFVYLR